MPFASNPPSLCGNFMTELSILETSCPCGITPSNHIYIVVLNSQTGGVPACVQCQQCVSLSDGAIWGMGGRAYAWV